MADRVVRAPDALCRQVVDGVLVCTPAGQTFRIGGSGVAVWEALAEPWSVEELARQLAERYAADAATVAGDLIVLVEDLRERGAVVRVPD